MNRHNPFRLIACLAAFLFPAIAQSEESDKIKPLLRIVCVSSIEGEKDIILAAREAGEKWRELGASQLRDSMITDWLPAEAGEIHLTGREGGTLKSLCHFIYPADASRGLVILIADRKTKTYGAHFVDPKKENFTKGSFLVFNLSPQTASVFLGPGEQKIEAGQRVVLMPTLEDNGMFRMQVTRPIADDKNEACYDRYVSGKQDSREMIFLLPDEQSGLMVMNLPLFSDLD